MSMYLNVGMLVFCLVDRWVRMCISLSGTTSQVAHPVFSLVRPGRSANPAGNQKNKQNNTIEFHASITIYHGG